MEQKLKFANIYRNCKSQFCEMVKGIWCDNTYSGQQESYNKEISKIIDGLFAPENAVPLVQCMDPYQSMDPLKEQEAYMLVNGLWEKINKDKTTKYIPYEHQFRSWQVLRNGYVQKNGKDLVKSIVVTTGTGSGKTECFMLPLVADLMDKWKKNKKNGVKAIFLYPLNALMEDQKIRLQKLLDGTDLHFAVYNGNLPDDYPNDSEPGALQKKERLEKEHKTFPNILETRTLMRSKKPDILLTNPSMLEYMLLRNKDKVLFEDADLSWIVIDETHTFTGAGAAELALLMKRVMIAFGTSPDNVRFATSSATIGDKDDKGSELKLRQFISDISGQDIKQVEIIDSDRSVNVINPASEKVKELSKRLAQNDFMRLDEIIPDEGLNIEQRLEILDELCRNTGNGNGLKAKVHFFFHSPNKGLKIELSQIHQDVGTFVIHTEVPLEEDHHKPYLDLVRCKCCGEYLAMGCKGKESDTYRAITHVDNDIFDDSARDVMNPLFFGLLRKDNEIDGNLAIKIKDDGNYDNVAYNESGWNVVVNTSRVCPYCGEPLTQVNKQNSRSQDESDGDIDNKKIKTFRLSSNHVSRFITPTLLDSLQDNSDKYPNAPHKGQQFISFVDSRQAAARFTLDANLNQEEFWIQSRVFHLLNQNKILSDNYREIKNDIDEITCTIAIKDHEVRELQKNRDPRTFDLLDEIATLREKKARLEEKIPSIPKGYLSWKEIFDELYKDPMSDKFCFQFSNKSEGSEELDSDTNTVSPETKKKYICSAMVDLFARRPLSGASAENIGLFTSYYKELEKLPKDDQHLPQEVIDFNSSIALPENKIHTSDWKDLLKIFLDHSVRSNESYFLKDKENKMDIWSCQRFQKAKIITKPALKPKEDGRSAIRLLLAALYSSNQPTKDDINKALVDHKKEINNVVDALWRALKEVELLEDSVRLDKDKSNWIPDDDTTKGNDPKRLDLMKLGFKLYDKVALCDARHFGKFEVPILEDTLFKGYSPRLVNGIPSKPIGELVSWETFPDNIISVEELNRWASEKRKYLWNYHIWGENGKYSSHINSIYLKPDLYIQAEHTAQVDKLIAKQSQDLFRDQKEINVLACSTTMEMGIDLGDLEAVMMCSIPPHPANYKQRAGRSGRAGQNKSVCITLCNSDAIGLRTLYQPIKQLINRPTAIPFVDCDSKLVVQRHVNSLLLRDSELYDNGKNNNLDQQIIDFFTSFKFGVNIKNGNIDYTRVVSRDKGDQVYPSTIDPLGLNYGTKYQDFIRYILNSPNENHLRELIKDTCLEGKISDACYQAVTDITKRYNEIENQVLDISVSFKVQWDAIEEELKKNNGTVTDGEIINVIESGRSKLAKRAKRELHNFSSILSGNLLEFLSTHRFTPNANMPVNIIEFDINLNNLKSWGRSGASNPSYQLQEALSQYTPGNSIVLSNRVRTIRGIRYTGWSKETTSFKKISTDSDRVILGTKDNFINPKGKVRTFTLIEPFAYLPDMNEVDTRSIDSNAYASVDAALIGTSDWASDESNTHLFQLRTNLDCGGGQILYYNNGNGYGYAVCTQCGKTMAENRRARHDNGPITDLPDGFYDDSGNHLMITSFKKNKEKCITLNDLQLNPHKVQRNVILGGFITTDFTEIRIRKDKHSDWCDNDESYKNFLTTLGVLLSSCLAEYLGKENRDINFLITPNQHLCIFDTNPGGSGYSNKLGIIQNMNTIIDLALKKVESSSSKDDLLDKFTVKYIDNLEIEEVKTWLKSEINSRGTVSNLVKNAYPRAKKATFRDIELDILTSNNSTIFVNDKYSEWNYDDTDTANWKICIKSIRDHVYKIGVIGESDDLPKPIYETLKKITDWCRIIKSVKPNLKNGILPVALTDNNLYITDVEDVITPNSSWAKDSVYRIDVSYFNSNEADFPTDAPQNAPTTSKDKIVKGVNDQILSTQLGEIVQKLNKDIDNMISSFIESCKASKNKIHVVYQDQYLRSHIGMITTLQFIDYFIGQTGCPFLLKFETEQYSDNSYCRNISTPYSDYGARDRVLNKLAESWIEQKGYDANVIVESRIPNALPHWRELSFLCGDKKLILYPNGGIINEWFLDIERAKRMNKYFRPDNTMVSDPIPLKKKIDIMYDVEVK